MRILPPTPESLREAAALLCAGRLVAFPTETVYGLGADATSGEAVARIYAAKGRPRFNPLIVHVASLDAAEQLGRLGEAERRLAAAFWPGPLTLVVEKQDRCPIADLVTAGLDTLALRVPAHALALDLIAAAGRPLAAPSANRSGHVSATRAEHVASDLGEAVDLILDGGPTAHGIESTIVHVTGDEVVVLRPGAICAGSIAEAAGRPIGRPPRDSTQPTAPGQLESHYAPRARLRLEARDVRPGEALLAFGPDAPATDGPVFNLSPTGDAVEAAANLFTALRLLDASGADAIAAMPVQAHGLGEAINDRLRRAASGR